MHPSRYLLLGVSLAAACASDDTLSDLTSNVGSGSGSGSGSAPPPPFCASADPGATCGTGSVCCTSGGVAGCFAATSCDRVGVEHALVGDVGESGVPTRLTQGLGSLASGPIERSAAYFATALNQNYTSTYTESFRAGNVTVANNHAHVRLDQRIRGIPVDGAQQIVEVDLANNAVVAWTGNLIPDTGLPSAPTFGANAAIAGAIDEAGLSGIAVIGTPALVYAIGPDNKLELAWRAVVQGTNAAGETEVQKLYAGATDLGLVHAERTVSDALDRTLYATPTGIHLAILLWEGLISVDAPVIVAEGGTTTDPHQQTTYRHLGTTYSYFFDRHDRDSYDDEGGPLRAVASVPFYPNAFWANPQPREGWLPVMVFGDGDGVTFGRLGNALDVVAHEFTHGVTQHSAGLVYAGESGGLNEAMSDIFGAAAEAAAEGITANTWKIGEVAFTPNIAGDALRYMNDPTLDGKSLGVYSSAARSVDVHHSSGIANRAFYLMVMGGSVGPITVPSIGMAKAEKIFYRALTTMLTPRSKFKDARAATVAAAGDLYGVNEASAVIAAWDAVVVPKVSGGVVVTLNNGRVLKGVAGAVATRRRFAIDVVENQALLDVRTAGGSGNANLILYRPDGTVAASSAGPTNAEAVVLATPAPGRYEIELVAATAYKSATVVAFTRTAGAAGPEVEPNDTQPSAQVLVRGATIEGTIVNPSATVRDADLYTLTLPPGATLAVNLERLALGATDHDLAILNVARKKLVGSARRGSEMEHAAYKNSSAAPMTIYVKVSGYRGSSSATEPYRLTATW